MDILKLISRHWIKLAKAHIGKSAGRPSKACPPLIGRVKPYDGRDDDDDDDHNHDDNDHHDIDYGGTMIMIFAEDDGPDKTIFAPSQMFIKANYAYFKWIKIQSHLYLE